MSETIPDAIYERLTNDTEFMSYIGSVGSSPSLIIGEFIPPNILLDSNGAIGLIETIPLAYENTILNYFRIVHRLRFYGLPNSDIVKLANRASKLLDRWPVVTDTGASSGSSASGPIKAPTDDPTYIGLQITISFLYYMEY